MNEMGLAALIESGLRLLSGSVSGQMSLVSTHDVSAMIADTRYGSRRSRTASSPPRKGEMIRATVAASLSWVSCPASSVGLCAKRSACAHRQRTRRTVIRQNRLIMFSSHQGTGKRKATKGKR